MRLNFMRWALLICVLAITMSGAAAQETVTPDADGDKLGAGVAAAAAEPEGVRVIISLRPPAAGGAVGSREAAAAVAAAQAEVIAETPGLTPDYRYSHVPALVATVTEDELAALQTNPDVLYVQVDERTIAHTVDSVPALGANIVHSTYGITGAGVRVAVLDTGVDTDHPYIAGSIVAQQCFNQGSPFGAGDCPPSGTITGISAEDGNGHGTNVTGIITSNNATYKGFAPDSEIVAIRVLGSNNSGWVSDWVAGLNWIIANQGALQVDVINMSLGTFTLYSGNCDAQNPATANVLAQINALGIVVFASSGNQGSATMLASPACNSHVIAVGATYDANLGAEPDTGTYNSLFGGSWPACADAATNLFKITCFTNSNAMLDILAPGARISNAYLNGGLATYRGTSQASPTAAGIAALMLDANPSLTPAQIESIMKSTGTPVTDGKNGLTFPAINAQDVIEYFIPQLSFPLNNSVLASVQPAFTWTNILGASSYEIQIGKTSPPTTLYSATTNTFTLPWQLLPGEYYWRVRTVFPSGDRTAWGEIRKVELQTPLNNAPPRDVYTTGSVTFTWNRISFAEGYQIQIARNATFTDLFLTSAPLSTATLSYSIGLSQSGLYYWRVRALKPDGTWGAWGAAQMVYMDLY